MVVAPNRARRPGVGVPRIAEPTPDELASCPFCEGREERTPPESLALGREDGAPDRPGWRIRVVPNLFPAFERQEVVIHAPAHVRSLADLDATQLRLVAGAWEARFAAARADGFPYVHALVNEGPQAGASLPHSHSQLVWLREQPPAAAAEDGSRIGELVVRVDLLVERCGVAVGLVHAAGGVPYESVIATGGPLPVEAFLGDALVVLGRLVARLRAVEGPVPWNAWLHAGAWPHLHLVPRLTVPAGIELGAGISVTTLSPECAAAALRSAIV